MTILFYLVPVILIPAIFALWPILIILLTMRRMDNELNLRQLRMVAARLGMKSETIGRVGNSGVRGLHFSGLVGGRRLGATLEVYLRRSFELWLESHSGTRATVSPIGVHPPRMRGHGEPQVVDTTGLAGLDGLEVAGEDPEWVRRLLGDEAVREALVRVTRSDHIATTRFVRILPRSVGISLSGVRWRKLKPEQMMDWAKDLDVIARAIDQSEPVLEVVQETEPEKARHALPSVSTRAVIAFVAVFLASVVVCQGLLCGTQILWLMGQ